MKKISILLSLALIIFFSSGCAVKKGVQIQEAAVNITGQQYYNTTWTIVYHNPELDRWDGKPTWSSHRIVSIIIDNNFPYFTEFFQQSWGMYIPVTGTTGEILLWCTTESWEILKADLTEITDKDQISWKYNTKQTNYTLNLWQNLSWKIVSVSITRPVFSYLLNSELMDIWRIGSCQAHSKIKDIKIMR